VLAYVFWHWPARTVDRDAYESSQRSFHQQLNAVGSEGFIRSLSFRVEGTAWLPVGGAYEDWYLVEGSFALDPLNDIAVSPVLRRAHDQAADGASGAGGLYRLRSGMPAPHDGMVHWLSKAPGERYDDFYARLAPGAVLWRRQMVLGPAPEFLLESDRAPDGVQAVRVARTLVRGQ
jgi:hypothetical protein